MRNSFIRFGIPAAAVLIGAAVVAWAEMPKVGMWEVTAVMTWQKSPLPDNAPPAAVAAMNGKTQTYNACLTQEQLDKYGTLVTEPEDKTKSCQITNVIKSANGMTADLACHGAMEGKGEVVATWSDSTHAHIKTHFLGTLAMGKPKPIEWTVEGSGVYKDPVCKNTRDFDPNAQPQ
jgi:hypothetical protein